MVPRECAEQALSVSQGMLEAARRDDWEETVKYATLLTQALSDGKGEWRTGWSVEDMPLMHNVQLNVEAALERMQHRREDLLSLLSSNRNQQRLLASYGEG